MSNLTPTQILGDDQLVKLAKQGEERAFSAIYKRYGRDLHRYCMGILGNADEASDAVQNAMIKAYRALPGEERAIDLKPWLYRVCHNESISLIRQRPPVQELRDELASIAPSPAQRVEDVIRVRQLLCDLSGLPERQRGALVMRELSGLTYDEIGASMGSTAAAAKQCVFEARSALHQCEDGRSLACSDVREVISASDKRMLRARKMRSHLSQCDGCRAFQMSIEERCGAFALLAPPIPLGMAALQWLTGDSDQGSSVGDGIARVAGNGGIAGQSTGLGSALTQLGTVSTALKSTAVVAAAVSFGIGPITGGTDLSEGNGESKRDGAIVSGPANSGSGGPSANAGGPGAAATAGKPAGGQDRDAPDAKESPDTDTPGDSSASTGPGGSTDDGSGTGTPSTPTIPTEPGVGSPDGDGGVTDPPPRSDEEDEETPIPPPTEPEPEPEPEAPVPDPGIPAP